MPLNIPTNSREAKSTLLKSIHDGKYQIKTEPHINNRLGSVEAKVIGGNLSILQALIGTEDQPDFEGKILFIEDLCEHLYAIDRIMHTLRKSGVLTNIKGLIVGGMTDMKDTNPGFGLNMEGLILEHLQYRKIPIAFNFPAGHIDDNRAIMFGRKTRLDVKDEAVCLSFL
jgi:muramoyltetrapeptide carboxypeptidase